MNPHFSELYLLQGILLHQQTPAYLVKLNIKELVQDKCLIEEMVELG